MILNFGPAEEGESWVYGAARPGFPSRYVGASSVTAWVEAAREAGIRRVCCLLPEAQLLYYKGLLDAYRQAFGKANVCWAPIEDYRVATGELLTETILPFLAASAAAERKVVVHCSAGLGRTGHVLAAWLVYSRAREPEEACALVEATGRAPYEAVGRADAGRSRLHALLQQCAGRPGQG